MDKNPEKIQYVADCLANYSSWVTSLNNLGLMDAAVLFDKQFLCGLWSTYGKYQLQRMLAAMDQMHIRELLPEILRPIDNTLSALQKENSQELYRLGQGSEDILNEILSDTYLYCYDEVRNDEGLSDAYIHILQILESTSFSCAGVLMDEFLGH